MNVSVFIAYHGSFDPNGTSGIAKQLEGVINRNVPNWMAYCGPDTNESTYDEHFDIVIPSSKLFLLVVNDSIAKNSSGQMDSKKCEYILKEIITFKKLIERGLRNKKDFAICYSGNLKNYDDITNYLKRLLYDIDPNESLYKGNHYYFTPLEGIIDWINVRLRDFSGFVLANNEYYPFKLLEEKVLFNIDNHIESFLIQMDKGMGKTTFVRGFSNLYSDKYFIFPYYIDKAVDSSRENFYWSLIDVLRLYNNILPSCNVNVDSEFYDFLTKIKETIFPNKKIVFIIDGIDNIPPSEYYLLSLFKFSNKKNDGINFIFTSKIYRNPESSSAYEFISTYLGEKIVFNVENPDYLKFLFEYYNNQIISSFYDGKITGLDVSRYFEQINPKNILSFSIITKMLKIYMAKYENSSLELIQSFSHSMSFYYEYIKNEYDSNTLILIKKILSTIIVSSLPLSIKDINALTSLGIEGELLEKYPFLEVFIAANGEHKYYFIHDQMKKIIVSDCKEFVDLVVNDAYTQIMAIPQDLENYKTFINEKFVYVKVLPYLLNLITVEEKRKVFERLSKINFSLSWGKTFTFINKENLLVNSIIENLPLLDLEKGRLYYILGFNYHLISKYSKSREYFNYSYEILSRNKNYIELNKNEYVQMLTRYSSILQEVENFSLAEKLYEEAIFYYEELYKEGKVTKDSFIFNLICLSHVYSHSNNLKKQIKTLKMIEKQFNLTKDNVYLNEIAFYNFSYIYFYLAKKNYKKALIYCDECINYYEGLDYATNDQAFLGNVMEVYSLKSKIILNMRLSKDYSYQFIEKTNQFLNRTKIICDFNNFDFESRVKISFANIYMKYFDYEKAEENAHSILYMFNSLSDDEQRNNIVTKHVNNARNILNVIKEKRQ